MSIVKIKENGVAQEFSVVRHNAYAAGRTLLLRRYIHSERQWHTFGVNAYASCALDAWFNNEYWGTLSADIRGQIAAVSIPYTPGNGNNALSSLSRRVFAVSATELGQATTYLNAEGTALANAATLKIATSSGGNAKAQWTRSPHTGSTNYAWYLNTSGNLEFNGCAGTYGVRPAFTLPSALSVDDNGNVVINTPPTISGSDSNLGTKTGAFTQPYTVTDADPGQTITVTEKFNGVQKRSYTATSGASNSFSVTATEWREILNGTHTIVITADDGNGGTATRTWTFSKSETQIELTLATPMATDAAATKSIMNITRQIPMGTIFTVEACNNGFDASPAWEDITHALVNGSKFFLSNSTKTTAKWGFNFRVKINRNGAAGECNIQNIGGNFE